MSKDIPIDMRVYLLHEMKNPLGFIRSKGILFTETVSTFLSGFNKIYLIVATMEEYQKLN